MTTHQTHCFICFIYGRAQIITFFLFIRCFLNTLCSIITLVFSVILTCNINRFCRNLSDRWFIRASWFGCWCNVCTGLRLLIVIRHEIGCPSNRSSFRSCPQWWMVLDWWWIWIFTFLIKALVHYRCWLTISAKWLILLC